MPRIFDLAENGQFDQGSFALLFFNNMIYLALLGLLGFLLSRPGTGGPNRYGAEPAGRN